MKSFETGFRLGLSIPNKAAFKFGYESQVLSQKSAGLPRHTLTPAFDIVTSIGLD